MYLNYVIKWYKSSIIIFDGYDNPDSIKRHEQQHRYQNAGSRFTISDDIPVSTGQEKFLSNTKNKKQLIQMLIKTFTDNNINVDQACDDADKLIVKTAVNNSKDFTTTTAGQDVDLFVLLIELAPENIDMMFYKPKFGRTIAKLYSSIDLQGQSNNIKKLILLTHSISGYDTTSALFNKGKKGTMKLFIKGLLREQNAITTFYNKNSSLNEVKEAGERILLRMYGCSKNITLDDHRFNIFQ